MKINNNNNNFNKLFKINNKEKTYLCSLNKKLKKRLFITEYNINNFFFFIIV